jgi:hypothetical protein
VSQIEQLNGGQGSPRRSPNRMYILIAAILVVVIVVTIILLVTQVLPTRGGEQEPTEVAEATTSTPAATSTPVPTFTPAPTSEPTEPPPPPTASAPVMKDTDSPIFDFESAGARPSVQWTGFFGQVVDVTGNPLRGISVIIWYRDGQAASPISQTDEDGYYEIHLAEAPLAGTWTIQLLTEDGEPASKLFTFETDVNTETGIQQIQVLWTQIP